MGKINQGPFGGVLGAIGNTIGSVWKGKAYLRIRPLKYNDRKSEKQVNQRNRFAACAAFSKPISDKLIKTSFEKMAEGITGYNLFIQTNVSCFGTDGTITDYEHLKVSVGYLPLPGNIAVANTENVPGTVTITWDDNSDEGKAAATDLLGLVTTNGKTPVVIKGLAFSRDATQAVVQLPYGEGEEVHVYVYFRDAEDETYSESFHALVDIPATPNP